MDIIILILDLILHVDLHKFQLKKNLETIKKGMLININTKEKKINICQKKGIPSVRQMKFDLENASPGFVFEWTT